ncbi:MAG: hypothetical protein WD042_15790 [Phycisphaeraceae bacterium]
MGRKDAAVWALSLGAGGAVSTGDAPAATMLFPRPRPSEGEAS